MEIKRKLIDIEIRSGFLYIPAKASDEFPDRNTKIPIIIDNERRRLTYNFDYKRLFGLTGWYKKHKVQIGDKIVIKKKNDVYNLLLEKAKPESSIEEAEDLIDISGLSSQAKGDIVEDRIKELIVLHGQGLLNVYKPVTDTQGIDLIVTKTGVFQPIFLQVKGRYNVDKKGYFLANINTKTFNPHHSYFIVGAYFNPQKLEIDDILLFIPSEEVRNANIVKSKNSEYYRIQNALCKESKGKWAPYLLNKIDIANKLIEKFEEIQKYFK